MPAMSWHERLVPPKTVHPPAKLGLVSGVLSYTATPVFGWATAAMSKARR